jgi:twitching motility protein PilT
MIEDKDRTKEITNAISQSFTTYGMQTFDQSLMGLFKQQMITYEEALRQCSNPDDFALRVSGISATSDSSWDSFEGGKDETQTPGGGTPSKPGIPRPPSGQRPVSQPAAAAGSRPTPAAGGKPAPTPAPSKTPAPGAPAADDDFQIERF